MRIVWFGTLGGFAAVAAFMACSAGNSNNGGNGTGTGTGTATGTGMGGGLIFPTGSGGNAGITIPTQSSGPATLESCAGPCQDFPSQPIQDSKSPPVATDIPLFTGTGTAPAPCLIEPFTGSLVPNNWLPPYVRWTPITGATTFEVKFSAKNQANILTVYTKGSAGWTMGQQTEDKDIWDNLRKHTWGLGADNAITVSVRAIVNGSLTAAATGTFNIATVNASGNVVYWATTGDVDSWKTNPAGSVLEGFSVGVPGYASVLKPAQVTQPVLGEDPTKPNNTAWGTPVPVACIGCHVSTPDGQSAAFIAQFADPIAIASTSPDAGTVGATPSWLSASAKSFLMGWPVPLPTQPNPWGQPISGKDGDQTIASYGMGTPTFSKAFWSDTVKLMVTSRGNDLAKWSGETTGITAQLYWVDLLAASSATVGGVIARTGDTLSAAAPTWSHDGTKILYTSTNVKNSERLGFNGNSGPEGNSIHAPLAITPIADLAIVPFNNKAGGTVTKVPGASEATTSEYYGAFSADDNFITYNAVPQMVAGTPTNGELYNQPKAEVFVIPTAGGTPTRLAANDPATCTKTASPGVNNSWPKWSPEATQDPKDANVTYYWIAFSSQRDGAAAQLYLAPVTVDSSTKKITTYPAVLFWNQNPATSNRTPAWDVFQISTTVQIVIR